MNTLLNLHRKLPFFRTVRYILLLLFATLLCSCEKALEPEYPDFLLSDSAIFEDTATIDAAIANIYTALRDNSIVTGNTNGANVLLGLYADELDFYRADSQIDNSFYKHTVLPNDPAVLDFWNNSYALVYSANAIIEGLENSPLSDSEKDPFKGEALFLRAYLHFYLSQLFGDIPYIKTTDYTINASVSRMPLEAVFNQMKEDVQTAKSLLPDIESSGEKLRISKSVATAFLAKIYLYNKQWQKAFEESNNLIESGVYSWQPDLNQVFLKESPSTIWQLKPEFEGAGTKEAEIFVFDFGPPYLYALTDELIMGFEAGDLRKDIWTREITDGSTSWYHAFKYKQYIYGGNSSEYSILFRLSEQYLIRAEAALQLGRLQEAKNNIDVVRLRAGLQPTNAASSDEIFKELMHQRKYELFTEQGNRWFDLKRTETANQILGPIKSGWKSTDVLFPLPQRELLLNPNLNPQNSGY